MSKISLASRVNAISESKSVQLASIISQLRNEGQKIIGLNVGEPDFETPKSIIEATKRGLSEGLTRYALVPGQPFLKDAIVNKLKRDQGLEINSENILVSNGSKQVLYSLFQVLCNDLDEVIIPKPYWVSFPEAVRLAGGVPVFVDTNENELDVERIKHALTDKTKAIVLNSPNNPSGVVYLEDAVKEVVLLAKEKGIAIISDEAYETLVFDNKKFIGPAGLIDKKLDNTFIVQSFSKSFCMTGFRLGYVAGPKSAIAGLNKLQRHICGNTPVFIQKGALAALENEKEIVSNLITTFQKRRDLAYNICKEIFPQTKKPDGAFYLFPKLDQEIIEKYGSDENLAVEILKQAKVALLPGSFFGAADYLRICYAADEESIEKGLLAIKDML